MYSISPTKLELFRKHKEGEYNEGVSARNVVDMVKGTQKWSKSMQFGHIFHKMLEHGSGIFKDKKKGDSIIISQDNEGGNNITIPIETADIADRFRGIYPDMVYEMPFSTVIKTEYGDAVINMVVDGLNGNYMHEFKTLNRMPSYEDFYRSLQWKLYLLATDAEACVYDLFKHQEHLITEYRQYTYHYQSHIFDEVSTYLKDFIEFCKRNGIEDYIKMKEHV